MPLDVNFASALPTHLQSVLGQLINQHPNLVEHTHRLSCCLILPPPIQPCIHTAYMQMPMEKVEGPSMQLSFLGITLDTVCMEARFPVDKLIRIKEMTILWLDKKKATKREILSLVGLLQHATKFVMCGRTFISRMYFTAAKVKELDYYTRISNLTSVGGTYSSIPGMDLLSYAVSPHLHLLIYASKRMHLALGDVVVFFLGGGSSGDGLQNGVR